MFRDGLAMSLLNVAVAVVTICMSWPQIWTSCVKGRTNGLAATSVGLAPAINITWVTYGLLLHEPLQIIVNGLTGIGNLVVLAALLLSHSERRSRPALRETFAGPAALVGSVAALSAFSWLGMLPATTGAFAVAMTGTIFGAFALLPQPLALLRDRAQDVSGISAGRYALGAASGSLWFTLGIVTGQLPVILSSFLGFASAAVVLHCVLTSRRRVDSAPAVIVLPDAHRELAFA